MDRSERLVAKYLRTCGFSDIQYEPNGNVPPDFLCDGRIAVEVRRLNQHYFGGTQPRGLEVDAIPLTMRMRRLLASLGPPQSGTCWYVFYRFERPLPRWAVLGSRIKKILSEFKSAVDPEPIAYDLGDRFHLKVFRSHRLWPTHFVLGGNMDGESGGFVLAEVDRNLQHCITEKSAKLVGVLPNYPEWWLVLPDHIAYGLDEIDREHFRKHVTIGKHCFDKIVLLHPNDHRSSFVAWSRDRGASSEN